MAEVYCASEPCPLFLNSTCVFYTGESLLYIGVQTNDTLEAIIVKINQAFQNTGIGYAFTNGVIQPTPSQPVQLGGALIQNTTIGGNFTLTFSGNVQAAKHITTGGSSSQFVKGDGTLDSTAYQPAANYITGLSGDVLASGPGVAAATLATVNFSSGTFGNGNTIPIVTVNSKGLVTNITPIPVTIPPLPITFIGDVVGSGSTGSNITLLLQNVNPNIYNTITPLKFSVNGKGLVTSASPITASDIVNILGFNPSGTAGSSGTSGTTGTSGTSGTSGIDGTFGTSGTSGTSGSSATSGTSGTSGSSGTAGTSGSTGTSGSSGTTGTSGSSGTTGTSGSSGTSGTTGTSGSSGTSGTTGTSGSSGLSGDRFKTTSTTTYTLQAPGNPGTLTVDPGLSYTVAQSIIIAFDANNHNEAEVTSYNPLTGVINFVTFTLTGSGTYSSWFVNIDGASGGDGSSGTSGTTGTSGSSGTSGTTGTSGSSGTSGTTGTSGSSGTSGTSATDGTGGTSGTSGSSATSGTSGTSGTSATSGTSGTSGSTPVNQVTGSGTSGQVAYFTGTTTITGENNLFWDATNDRLGIGTNTPATTLEVNGIGLFTGAGLTGNTKAGVYILDSQILSLNGTGPRDLFIQAQNLSFYTGTTYGEKMKLFSDGNLLIQDGGTFTNNGARLQVSGEGRFYQPLTNTTSYLTVENNRARNAAIRLKTTVGDFLIGTGIGADVNQFQIYDNTAGANRLVISSTGASTFNLGSGEMRLNRNGTSEFLKLNTYYLLSDGNDQLLGSVTGATSIYAGNGVSPRLTITSSGNVGIGTGFTPSYPLHIYVSVADWGAVVQNLNASSYGMYVRGGATNGSTSAFYVANTASTMLLDIKGSGAATFSSSVTAVTNLRVNSTGASGSAYSAVLINSPVVTWNLVNDDNGGSGDLRFYNDSLASDAIRIKRSNNNVLIGTTTDAGYKLDVNGITILRNNVYTSGESGIEFTWSGNTINDTRSGRIRPISTPAQNPYAGGLAFDCFRFNVSSYQFVEGMRLNGSGNLLIGTTTDNGFGRVQVSGSISAVGGVRFSSSGADANRWSVYWNGGTGDLIVVNNISDIRAKKDFDYNIKGLETIQKLKPLKFTWKDGTSHSTSVSGRLRQYGFIAQETMEADDYLAWYNQNQDTWGIEQYESFSAVIVKAIQELKAELDELKGNN